MAGAATRATEATSAKTPRPAANPSPAKADTRRRQRRGDERRQQILDAAVELFSARGYRSTGLAELGDTVGMTNPGLLYYFGTKERLLLEVVAERHRIEGEQREDLDPATLTLDTLTDIARQNVENVMLTRLYVVLAAESLDAADPLHAFFVERYDRARRHIGQLLEHAIATGELRDDVDVTQLGTEVLAMLMGLELQWLMDPDRFDLVATMAAYVESLRARLAPAPPKTGSAGGSRELSVGSRPGSSGTRAPSRGR
jgi:AcrR family transcriptional regulator